MNKELTPLEACRIIKEHDFPLMITTLPPIPATMDGKTEKDLWDIIETTLKALEIIKEKIFNKENFDWYDHNDDFTYVCLDGSVDFTKEEAELLKEVLL